MNIDNWIKINENSLPPENEPVLISRLNVDEDTETYEVEWFKIGMLHSKVNSIGKTMIYWVGNDAGDEVHRVGENLSPTHWFRVMDFSYKSKQKMKKAWVPADYYVHRKESLIPTGISELHHATVVTDLDGKLVDVIVHLYLCFVIPGHDIAGSF